ncbi:TPA: hypothetical protein ACKQAZ_001297 [Pseudomonas aeruginosa]
MTESKICTCPSGDGSLRWPCPKHPAVEQAGGERRDALQSIMEWTAAENIPDERKLCLIRNAARAALAQPSPVRSSLLINGYQLRAALDFIAPDGTAEQLESEACIEWRQQDADFLEAGLYAFCAEYPEEGGVLLDEEPTTAQPSPLQSEQAEAERPEVVGYRSKESGMVYEQDYGLKNPEALTTVAECERIVGALRADRDSWAEQAEQRLADWDEMRKERDAALARVAGLELGIARIAGDFLPDNSGQAELALDEMRQALHELLAAAPTQAQHSVPKAWLDVQAERRRQVENEGWTPEHDDEHSYGQMGRAAACYALAGSSAPNDGTAALLVSLAWPWDEQWWKPSTARRDLVKACALALAEIERLDRATATQGGPRDA